MPHVVLGLYVLSFSLGIAVILLSLISFERFRDTHFIQFAVFLVSATLLLLVEVLETYDRVVVGVLGPALPFVTFCLTVAGNGLMGYILPVFVFRITQIRISPSRRAAHILLAITLAAIGGLKEAWGGMLFLDMDYAGLFGLYAYAASALFFNYGHIESALAKPLIRVFLALNVLLFLPAVAQLVLQNLPSPPPYFSEYPFAQIVYYVGLAVAFVYYAVKYLYRPDRIPKCALPEAFVRKYGISPRECEIISMILQGLNNRRIGENLFISAMTVKNHIYHIYRKTGAENKLQLLNLINIL